MYDCPTRKAAFCDLAGWEHGTCYKSNEAINGHWTDRCNVILYDICDMKGITMKSPHLSPHLCCHRQKGKISRSHLHTHERAEPVMWQIKHPLHDMWGPMHWSNRPPYSVVRLVDTAPNKVKKYWNTRIMRCCLPQIALCPDKIWWDREAFFCIYSRGCVRWNSLSMYVWNSLC